MTDGINTPQRPVPAATVVLLRPGDSGLEVLLIRRPATMAFGPNIHAFPGGRVDPADAAPAALDASGLTLEQASANLGLGLTPDGAMTPASALAHHVAAARETLEEVGVEIAARDLIALSRWVTPPSMARRFDARFFAVFVPPGTDVRADQAEVAEARWMTPEAALDPAAGGEIELWQPTFVTLQQLESLADPAAVRAAFAVGVAAGGPVIERRRPDLARVDAAWAGGIPGRRAVGWLIGRRDVVVVDPADPTGVTIDAIIAEVAAMGGRLAGVVISDLAPERHAGVEMFAHGLGLPVAGPAGTAVRAPYPVIEMAPAEPLPFGDPGLTFERALSPA
jgi:8-oxo-dGTP pyrophosphatase MutT (NUDIX family)